MSAGGDTYCGIFFYALPKTHYSCTYHHIPKGGPSLKVRVIVDGDVTRVFNVAGEQLVQFDNPTREDYAFTGWSKYDLDEGQTTLELTHINGFEERSKSNFNLFACWEARPQPHSLILNLDDGSWNTDTYIQTSYLKGDAIPWDELVPVKRYYDFVGWKMDDGSKLPKTMPSHDVRATAQWKEHEYIMYFVSGRNEPYVIRAVKDTNIADQLPGDPEREGYTFGGWYPNDPPTIMPGESSIYTAKWTANIYDLTFANLGRAADVTIKVPCGTLLTATEVEGWPEYEVGKEIESVKPYHIFRGWTPEIETMPAGNLTLNAIWEPIKYHITFDMNGGQGWVIVSLSVFIYAYGETINWHNLAPIAFPPTREHYDFIGWDAQPRTMPGHDLIVTAQWTPRPYALTFDLNGGEWPEGVTPQLSYTYGEAIDWDSLAPILEHYDFVGWDAQPETMPDHDITATAEWTPHMYTLTFTVDGEAYDTATGEYGEEVPLPEYGIDAPDDYAFAGWKVGEETLAPGATIDIVEDMEISAVWKLARPAFRTHSLLLSGEIGVNFFMELPELEGVDYGDSYMEFTIRSKNGATTRDPFDSSDRDVNGKGYYGFTVFVSSIQMAAPITAVFHYGDGQTVEQTYSVKDYIVAYDAVASRFDATTTALVRAIADYGHYAQPALSLANGWTIGADYAEMDTYYRGSLDYGAVASAVKPYAIVKALSQSDIEKVNFDINLLSRTNIRVFFAPKTGYKGSLSAAVDGNSAAAKKQPDGRWLVQIEDISAHQLSKMYGVEVQTTTGTASVQVSVLSYVDAILSSNMDARYKEAVSALYYYYRAAMDYRNAHNY